jgi:uncharacterized protein (TIGR02117 family)
MRWPEDNLLRAVLTFLPPFWLLLTPAVALANWSCSASEASCKTIFIVHNAWHASIVVDRQDVGAAVFPELSDFPDAKFLEFSWGDQDYFPDPNSGIWAALRAAFWSGGSVLHIVGFSQNVVQFYSAAEIFTLRLSPLALQQLIRHISQTISRDNPNHRATAAPGLFAYSRFYRANGKFTFFRTCNTWVAEALEAAGIPVFPESVVTAGSLASQLAELEPPS